MTIFYCIMLVFIFFVTVMEIVAKQDNNILRDNGHKDHLYVYSIFFIIVAVLLAMEKYM